LTAEGTLYTSTAELDEVTTSSIRMSDMSIYAKQFVEDVSLPVPMRYTSTGNIIVASSFDEITLVTDTSPVSASLPRQFLSITPNDTIQPLSTYGWTAGIISSTAPGATFTLTNSANDQFSIGGNMLRLEKVLGAPDTNYNIIIVGSAPGYQDVTTYFTIRVTDNIKVGLVERINALSTSTLWQDSAGTNQVTANGQAVKKIRGSIAGWEASTSTNGPVYTANAQNGQPGLTFNGTNQSLNFTTSAAINFFGPSWRNKQWTIIVVCKIASTGTNKTIFAVGNNTGSSKVIYNITRVGLTSRLGYVIGSGGITVPDGDAGEFTLGQAAISSISSDGAPDEVHVLFQHNGIYGYTSNNGNPTSHVPLLNTTGTMTPSVAVLGGRTDSSTDYFNGTILDILFYDRYIGTVEMGYIHKKLGEQWGINIDNTANEPTLDLSNHTLEWSDDFDTLNMNTQFLGSGNATLGSDSNPTGWTPAYWNVAQGKDEYGSDTPLLNETAWMIDPRNPIYALNGITDSYTANNSVLTIKTYPRPEGISSTLTKGRNYLGGALISQQWKTVRFPGAVSIRFKTGRPQLGVYTAAWLMPNNQAWYDEVDINEQLAKGTTTCISNYHCIPYPSIVSVNKGAAGWSRVAEPMDEDFHEYTYVVDETGRYIYWDGVLFSKFTGWKGIVDNTLTSVGSGLANGTFTIYASGGRGNAIASLVISGGQASSVTLLATGQGFTNSNAVTWYSNSSLTIPLSTTFPGVVIDSTVANDPPYVLSTFEPFYILLSMSLGSISGTFDPALNYYPSFEVDRVRLYKRNMPVPATLTLGYDTGFDGQVTTAVNNIVAAYSELGQTLTGSARNALARAIRSWMSYELRYDLQPLDDGVPLPWNTQNKSLWSAKDLFYIPGLATNKATAMINLKSPGTGNLTEVGSGITWTKSNGLSLPGTANTYLNSGVLASQFNNQDNHFGIFLPATPTNSNLGCVMGYSLTAKFDASVSKFDARLGTNFSISSIKTLSLPLTGHITLNRGWRHAINVYKNGETLLSGYYSGNAVSTWTGPFKIGSQDGGTTAGAAFSFLAASVGRRLFQEESDMDNQILRQLFTDLGITLTV